MEIQANNFAQLINYRLLYFFIEKVEGLTVLGVFSVALSITETLWVLCRSTASLQYSKLINSKDSRQHITLTNLSARFSAFSTSLGLIVLFFVPKKAFTAFLGQTFDFVASVIPYLAPAILSLAVFTVFNHYFSANYRNRINIKGSVIGNIILVSSAYPLITNWGMNGASFAYSLTHFGMLIFYYANYKSQTHVGWTDFIPKHNDLRLLSKNKLVIRTRSQFGEIILLQLLVTNHWRITLVFFSYFKLAR